MSLGLTLLVFCILLCLTHMLLKAVPGMCPPASQSFMCSTFDNFWHSISLYNREGEGDRPQLVQENEFPLVDDDFEPWETVTPISADLDSNQPHDYPFSL